MSTALVDRLTADELVAVLAHEAITSAPTTGGGCMVPLPPMEPRPTIRACGTQRWASVTTLRLLGAAVVMQVAGQLYDARWHAQHDEFERLPQQLEAHWLLWLGWLMALAVAVVAVVRDTDIDRSALFGVAAAGVFLVAVTVWHTIEHESGRDPDLPHLLLGIGQAIMIIGVGAAYLRSRPPDEQSART